LFERRHWIPPLGLAFGQLCHGLSWLLAVWIALRAGVGSVWPAEIAWIHLVALGWVTVTALAILLHAIPAFVDVTWRYETLARYALGVAAAAIAAFIAALLWALPALGAAATAVACSLFVYLATAWLTLRRASRSHDRIDRAVASAFALTFGVFAAAIALGATIAWMLAGARVPSWIAQLPPAHANLALFGWLTLLIYGVSARTLRPITGNRSSRPVLHRVGGSATLVGAVLLAIGTATALSWATWLGGAFVAAGAAAYIADVAPLLVRASVAHRLPQAFVAAGLVWLAVAIVLGAGVLAGMRWQEAFGFVLLAGWVGQMVNAHTFHIGVRLIATIYRGDDDETRPETLLNAQLTWLAFGAAQLAVVAVAAGLLAHSAPVVAAGAAIGVVEWVVMMTALALARNRSRGPEVMDAA
jgi:hypothetical protein